MSEIRNTTTIEEIEVPAREPLISLADVLTGVGWVAFQGTKLAVKGAVAGTVLACRGGKAIAGAIQESRRHASFSEVSRIAASASSAREAITSLAEASLLEVPQRELSALAAKLETLVVRNDKRGVEAVARQLVAARQIRLQAQLLPIVAEACRAIGFVPDERSLASGVIVARGNGGQTAVLEVAKCKDGGVRIHSETDGFHGGSCVPLFHEPLGTELRKRGVRSELAERRQKPNRPVSIGHPQRIRCRN